MEEQKAVNAQANQRIDTVESTLNKKIDNLQSQPTVFNLKANQPAAGAGKGEISISDTTQS